MGYLFCASKNINRLKKIISKILDKVAARVVVNMPAFDCRNKNEAEIILSGTIMSAINADRTESIINNIQNAEFKVFSQFGDDGIIQFIVNYLEIEDKFFIEFGVEDYRESNTRFLLMNNNWEGLVMDGSQDSVSEIINAGYYWRYGLTAKHLFVDEENINDFLVQNSLQRKIGLLHIDIDGNDYWIWKAIHGIDPTIVIVEYNAVFGVDNPWTVPYDKGFNRTKAHFSNLFWGTSLLSLCELAKEKGYIFIGTNNAGNNAYFIKNGKQKDLKELNPEQGFTLSKYRESRNENGALTFLSGSDRIKALKGCEVYNTRLNKIEKI